MSRLKLIFAGLVLTAIVGVLPQAHAQATLKVMIAGASGSWQAMGVGAYNAGACPSGSLAGCAHYTNNTFILTDSRPTLLTPPGASVTDKGTIWIVWDNTNSDPTCATACNVWAYLKVDSIVGTRCYFAHPHCTVGVNPFPAPNGQIGLPAPAWGADSTPPAPVMALFTTGTNVTVGASEIRPEDALFGQCRINSALGGGNDGLNGLGFGSNTSGVCPVFGANQAHLEGTDLLSGKPGSTSTAHPMAFNISGKDPFSGQTIPVASTVAVGAVPLIFITNRQGALANVTNATLSQLQTAFSGADCRGSVFNGGTSASINVYSREPLSGTMNTAEYTAFRLPRDSAGNYDLPGGQSQETGLGGITPVSNVPCTVGGGRYQGIGQGELNSMLQNSNTSFGVDGIGYTFFSYGNVSGIANNANYAYLTVDGVDPIFQVYGSTYDPGQPATAGALPAAANLPATCAGGAGSFPCAESKIWKGGESFPNVRNGSYRQWAMIRLFSDGTALTNAKALVSSTQTSAVTTVPDFIPAIAKSTDKGLQLFRSHYTQVGVAPVNGTADKGGEEGGCIVPNGSIATKVVQRNQGCVVGP
jgi:hypothetical protein